VFAALQLQAMKEKEREETADSDALTNDTNARSAMDDSNARNAMPAVRHQDMQWTIPMDDSNARNAMPAVRHQDMPLVSLVSPHTHMCM